MFMYSIFYICGGPSFPTANIHISVYLSAIGQRGNRRKAKRPVDQDTDSLTRKEEVAHGSKAEREFTAYQQADV